MINTVNSIRSVEMGEPASAVRSLSRRVKPSGIRGAVWRNPPQPSDTPQMVGDGMAGRPNTVIREIGLGETEFMPLEGRRAAQDEVRAPIVAKKRVMIVERRECRKMEGSWTERQKNKPLRVPARAVLQRTQPSAYDLGDTVERKAT